MPATSHLTPAEVEEFGRELDKIRDEVLASLSERDARYIRGLIATQRKLELCGRALLFASWLPPAWMAGTTALAAAKILENMEIGHNVLHGQWDWMGDPKIHSTTWEWDFASPADQWKHSHNFVHHTWTNVLGKDRDIGYSAMRITPEQRWHPIYLAQPLYNALLALFFEYGIAIYDLELERIPSGKKDLKEALTQLRAVAGKIRRQVVKDYVAFPLLAGPAFIPVLFGNLTANIARNVWGHTIIFCGHFAEGAEVFTEDRLEGETHGEWYVRQLLGSCNIDGGRLFHIMSGNLSHQIEHHLFPDMPSNRYAEIAPRVRALCERFGLPYMSGSLTRQAGSVWKRVLRLAFPGPARRLAPASPARRLEAAA
ncbi:acyl-CoA desaturase [Microbispora amethystogenes]|uniref:Acyl-CoA desaturase n=3 Tax=Microbispora TaxID=2005 RepID=A0ABY3M2G6_9ACTN|nr:MULTISPECIES: acyl-CoA desaturase [Microbispora]RGA05543.1 acyl-CoA desaturase [Microbispora triticiradicis]TLP57825.1 acyl-CoA desaturase [Microbispora fusca]TYB64578.1 acyl-CoA desaturase [Microbispora tritici]GLW25267.1 fatty acid desaturase [Microbispora amethystogenes]